MNLALYATAPYPCGYLPEQEARSQVATPIQLINTNVYSALVQQGFRRSGQIVYRPWCNHCTACIPVRLPVNDFLPSRTQRRTWQRHQHLEVCEQPLVFNEAHYALYSSYLQTRHTKSGDTPEDYRQFLLTTQVNTRLIEFSENNIPRMLSVIDVLSDGLSAVYTFYDTTPADNPRASYGTFGILWLIELCRTLELPYLYLGYWVKDSPKMAYKANFQPLEALREGQWKPLLASKV